MHNHIVEAYSKTNKRLFLMDYDGVLAEITKMPWEAKPTAHILDTLQKLAMDKKNTIVLITGRKHEDLDAWFGKLPISFAAEHGMLFKEAGKEWIAVEGLNTAWKEAIRTLMQSYVDKLDDSFIEEKTNGLVWHYRAVHDQDAAEAAAKELADNLQVLAPAYYLRVMRGKKIVETQPLGVSKGIGVKHWLDMGGWDFMLVAGDDVTDEDMFKAVPSSAFTVKIGSKQTAARHRLAKPKDMLKLLADLMASNTL